MTYNADEKKRGEGEEEKSLWCASDLEKRPKKVRGKKWAARKGGLFYREEEGEGVAGGCRCSFVELCICWDRDAVEETEICSLAGFSSQLSGSKQNSFCRKLWS